MYDELDERREWIGKQVVDIAYHIYKALGPGLLEKVYETCFSMNCISGIYLL